MTPNFIQYNNMLREARLKKGFSIEDLAIKVDVSSAKMQDIENLCSYPKRDIVERIASELDIPFQPLWTALGHA